MTKDMKSIEDATLRAEIEGYIINPANGEQLKCRFKDPTEEELETFVELEEATEDGDEEAAEELEQLLFNEFFLHGTIDQDSPLAQKQAVITGFMRAVGADNAVTQDAEELMEQLDQQGNR